MSKRLRKRLLVSSLLVYKSSKRIVGNGAGSLSQARHHARHCDMLFSPRSPTSALCTARKPRAARAGRAWGQVPPIGVLPRWGFPYAGWSTPRPRATRFILFAKVSGPCSKMKLQFCVENPYTGALKVQPYMSEMMEYATVLDYCRFQTEDRDGEMIDYPFRKPTMLCSNLPDMHELCRRCSCPNFRHASSLIGDRARGKRLDHGGGKSPPLHFKHMIPTQVHMEVLKRAMRGEPNSTWVLDLFSGTQSLRRACDRLHLKYAGVDIESRVKTANGHVETDIVRDLSDVNITEIVNEAASVVGERPQDLLLLWASPPCTTFSQCQTLNAPEKRHRDYSDPQRRARSEAAQRDDALVENLVRQLL